MEAARCGVELLAAGLLAASLTSACSRGTRSGGNGREQVGAASVASSLASQARLAPAASAIATVTLPEAALRAMLGCWQLEDRERWNIRSSKAGGAEVTRAIVSAAAGSSNFDYVRRAALPSAVMFDATQRSYAFFTAGPIHAQLFAFSMPDQTLDGSWAVSRAPGAKYEPQPGRVQLHRCSK